MVVGFDAWREYGAVDEARKGAPDPYWGELWIGAAYHTTDFCLDGYDSIRADLNAKAGAVLGDDDWPSMPCTVLDLNTTSAHSFLERIGTPSDFGPFSYRPVDVRISTRAKPEHVAQLGFYGLLLGSAQGHVPETADLILVDGSRETIELAEHMGAVEQAIEHIQAIQQGQRELPTLSSECGMCPWHDYCLRMLCALKDVSLLNGFGGAKKGALVAAGYADLPDISNADPEELSDVKGIGESIAERMVMQAQVLLDGRPRVLSIPQFPEAEVELYLDMECQQQTQVTYLIGVLECSQDGEEKFRPFLAGSPGDEGKMWREFLAYLEGLPDELTIYHYHQFESIHLRKLVERHGIDEELEDKLFGNLIDLHRVLKESVVLPLHSYGLKPVAKWMGFEWRETEADAAMSMLWFDLWLTTGNKRYLELAVEYNEDDCRATKRVREWVGGGVGARSDAVVVVALERGHHYNA